MPPQPPPPSAPWTPGQLPPGAALGPYRIARLIGTGSSAAVYQALDPRPDAPHPDLALKVIALGNGDVGNGAVRRFFRVADAARRLHHAHVAEVFDAGESQRLGWLAMTLAPGHDLQRHTHAGDLLPLPAALEVAACVAGALAQAHRQGIVHRDVKPANVVVDIGPPPAQWPHGVVLTDFGVARISEALVAGDATDGGTVAGGASYQATASGYLLGTVAYMSPEQLAGAPVDAASDLYSLGAMLFHLLTGVLPHGHGSMAQQMHAIANQPPPALVDARPALHDAWAPTTVSAVQVIVWRLLAKRPSARGGDADAVADELRAVPLHPRH